MGPIDIVIIALFGVFFLFGFMKGFTRQIWGIIIFAGAVAAVIFLSGPLSGLLMKADFISDGLQGLFADKTASVDISSLEIAERTLADQDGVLITQLGVWVNNEFILLENALQSFSTPSFVNNLIIDNAVAGSLLGDTVNYHTASVICTLISGAVIFIGIMIAANVIKFIFVGKRRGSPNIVNRLAGGVFKCGYAFLMVAGIMFLIGMLGKVGLADVVENFIVGDGDTVANPVAYWFYEGNWMEKIYQFVMSLIPQ